MPNPIRTTYAPSRTSVWLSASQFNALQGRTEYPASHAMRPFRLKQPRTRARSLSAVGRGRDKQLYVRAYCPTRKFVVWYTQSEVRPEDWATIFTPEVLENLELAPEPKPLPAYHLNAAGAYQIVKHKKHYEVGCQTISKSRMIRLCKAILEDCGYEIKD